MYVLKARGKFNKAVVAAVGVPLAVSGGLWFGMSSDVEAEWPPLTIRGKTVDRSTFDFDDLTSDDVAEGISEFEQAAFQSCMAARGFTAEPEEAGDIEYNLAYEAAAIGEASSPEEIVPRTFILPDGSQQTVRSSVVPGTCWWEAWSSLGGEPVYREAFGRRMIELVGQANALSETESMSFAEAQYRIAQENESLVDAWVEMHDAAYRQLPVEFKDRNR